MFNQVLVQQKLKPTYQDGMASAGVPLVGRRLRGHVEVGKAKNHRQDFVAGAAGRDDLVALRRQQALEVLNLVDADDDLRRLPVTGGRGCGDGREPLVGGRQEAPVDSTLPPTKANSFKPSENM